jgi:putative NADH-flavin reductase
VKITIVAATGGIGRQLLEQSVAAGHDVTVVVRNPQSLPPTPARAVSADLASADAAALQPAVAGADAVLSATVRTCASLSWPASSAVPRSA